jgi:hypothetical protein
MQAFVKTKDNLDVCISFSINFTSKKKDVDTYGAVSMVCILKYLKERVQCLAAI